MHDITRTMHEAMNLMQGGDLQAATQAIQRGLRVRAPVNAPARDVDFIDVPFEVVHEPADDTVQPTAAASIADATDASEADRDARVRDTGHDGDFCEHRFTSGAGALSYKLYVPAGLDPALPAPLLVMLHGCTQSPDDFARGTRMNALAHQHGYVVAYPAQSQKNNAGKCWNWFRSGDQQRGRGEPALIAALTSHLVDRYRLDARRVYVAGLSAGGAMAAVLGHTYPDVYAAIGVHSGLPHLAAHDLPSALAAMRQGGTGTANGRSPAPPARIPAIVFHGDRDATVDPCNGDAVLAQSIGSTARTAPASGTTVTVSHGSTPRGRAYTRTIHTDTAGIVVAEQWVVHDAGHAWFGGDASGSYTDPAGPDASAQMLRFFAERARATTA